MGLLIIILTLYMIKQEHFARSMLFIFYGLNVVLEVIVRNIIRYALRKIRRRGFNQKHILLVGYSRATEEYIDRILAFPEWGYTIRGILDDHVTAGTTYRAVSYTHLDVYKRQGVSCEMDTILNIAERYGLKVIEDAAQGVHAYYKGKALGTLGDFGCFSFHETKNYTMGEGGALLFQEDKYLEKAEVLREKGTDRSKFFRGQVDKYTWVDFGSSYLPSELNAAYLCAQLEACAEIDHKRMDIWNYYHDNLKPLAEAGYIVRPEVPEYAVHNAHTVSYTHLDVYKRQL